MLFVIENFDAYACVFLQTTLYCIDRAVTNSLKLLLDTMICVNNCNFCIELRLCLAGKIVHLELSEMQRLLLIEILLAELNNDMMR